LVPQNHLFDRFGDVGECRGRLPGKIDARVGGFGSLLRHHHRGIDSRLDADDEGIDFLGGFFALVSQLANFRSDDTESLAVFPGPDGFDGGVEGQHIGLVGEVADQVGDAADLFGLFAQAGNLLGDRAEQIGDFMSPIFCYFVKDAATALRVGNQLQERGIFAPAIRPPTVNTSRIRISLMATHQPDQIRQLAEALKTCRSGEMTDG